MSSPISNRAVLASPGTDAPSPPAGATPASVIVPAQGTSTLVRSAGEHYRVNSLGRIQQTTADSDIPTGSAPGAIFPNYASARVGLQMPSRQAGSTFIHDPGTTLRRSGPVAGLERVNTRMPSQYHTGVRPIINHQLQDIPLQQPNLDDYAVDQRVITQRFPGALRPLLNSNQNLQGGQEVRNPPMRAPPPLYNANDHSQADPAIHYLPQISAPYVYNPNQNGGGATQWPGGAPHLHQYPNDYPGPQPGNEWRQGARGPPLIQNQHLSVQRGATHSLPSAPRAPFYPNKPMEAQHGDSQTPQANHTPLLDLNLLRGPQPTMPIPSGPRNTINRLNPERNESTSLGYWNHMWINDASIAGFQNRAIQDPNMETTHFSITGNRNPNNLETIDAACSANTYPNNLDPFRYAHNTTSSGRAVTQNAEPDMGNFQFPHSAYREFGDLVPGIHGGKVPNTWCLGSGYPAINVDSAQASKMASESYTNQEHQTESNNAGTIGHSKYSNFEQNGESERVPWVTYGDSSDMEQGPDGKKDLRAEYPNPGNPDSGVQSTGASHYKYSNPGNAELYTEYDRLVSSGNCNTTNKVQCTERCDASSVADWDSGKLQVGRELPDASSLCTGNPVEVKQNIESEGAWGGKALSDVFRIGRHQPTNVPSIVAEVLAPSARNVRGPSSRAKGTAIAMQVPLAKQTAVVGELDKFYRVGTSWNSTAPSQPFPGGAYISRGSNESRSSPAHAHQGIARTGFARATI